MTETALLISVTTLLALGIVAIAALTAWHGWLQLKSRELDRTRAHGEPGLGTARIELADVKERLRKLEAIAAGVDL